MLNRVLRFLSFLPVSILFSGTSLAIGLMVPVVYAWIEGQKLHRRELSLLYATVAVLGLTVGAASVTALIRFFRTKPSTDNLQANERGLVRPKAENSKVASGGQRRFQFSFKYLLVAMTAIAALLAIAPWLDNDLRAMGICAIVFWILVREIFSRGAGLPMLGSWLAAMYFPFAWVVWVSKPLGNASGMLAGIPVLPTLFPAVFLGKLMGFRADEGFLPFVFTAIVLVVGVWVVRRFNKLAIACVLGSLLTSILGSMLFYVFYLV